jgi:hypothetical protein
MLKPVDAATLDPRTPPGYSSASSDPRRGGAKPIIDVQVSVDDVEADATHVPALPAAG